MMKNVTLTIDEIHEIREEHCRKTGGMSYDEYRKSLDAETADVLRRLSRMREERETSKENPVAV